MMRDERWGVTYSLSGFSRDFLSLSHEAFLMPKSAAHLSKKTSSLEGSLLANGSMSFESYLMNDKPRRRL